MPSSCNDRAAASRSHAAALDSAAAAASTTTTISHQQNTQLASLEYNHQTFQEWLDLLVDSNSTEEIISVINNKKYNRYITFEYIFNLLIEPYRSTILH